MRSIKTLVIMPLVLFATAGCAVDGYNEVRTTSGFYSNVPSDTSITFIERSPMYVYPNYPYYNNNGVRYYNPNYYRHPQPYVNPHRPHHPYVRPPGYHRPHNVRPPHHVRPNQPNRPPHHRPGRPHLRD